MMANSLAKLSNGAESYTLDEWLDFQRLDVNSKLAALQILRDPLKHSSFRGQEIVAVFGYYLGRVVNYGIRKSTET